VAHTKTWLAMGVVGAAQGINIKWRAWPQAAVAQAGDRHTASSGSICCQWFTSRRTTSGRSMVLATSARLAGLAKTNMQTVLA